MGMQINTNMAANNAYRSLSNTQTDLSKSLEKLSSGLRINRAGDDAAGLAISEGLKSQIGGLTVAARNAQDGIGAVQTAEGGLNQAHSILQRLRDLAVQAANDTNNAESRGAIKTEADSLVKELDRIADSTNFNGTQLLDGSKPTLTFQVGANSDANSQIDVNLVRCQRKAIADCSGPAASGPPHSGCCVQRHDGSPQGSLPVRYNFHVGATAWRYDDALARYHHRREPSTSVDEFVPSSDADTNFARSFTASVVEGRQRRRRPASSSGQRRRHDRR